MTKKLSILFALMLSTLMASANDIEVKNADGVTIYYNYINEGTELEVTYDGENYSLPANEYKGIVVIPEEVTYMGRTRKVTRIGGSAFAECNSLTSVTVPNSVTSIAGGVFYRCTNLTSITLPNSIKSIGFRTFYECSSLTSFTVPNSVTNIGDEAFSYCRGLTSVTVPNSVKSMGEYAFSFCSKLTSVTIGNSVNSIGEGAFKDCYALTSVHITDIAAWCKIKFNFSGSNPLSYAGHLFMDGKEITDLVIPNNVTSIGNKTFRGCIGLTSLTISNSVTNIGDEAFYNCSGLTSVTIPNSVTSLGYEAFYNCSGLTSVTIPNSVKSIGNEAFTGCSGLKSVTISDSLTSIGNRVFSGCTRLTSITIPNRVTTIGEYAFNNCSDLTSVTIPNSVTSIGNLAFEGANISTIVSLIENPYKIVGKTSSYRTFSQNTFNNATLYVPVGTKNRYKATDGWKDFFFIEEGEGPGGDTPLPPTPEIKKCATPTISYENGKLKFSCDTEGATFQYSITDTDIKAGSGNEVQLTTTYKVTVYATKAGYENSDVATKEIDLGTSGIRGDVNNDGVVSMPDVMFIINYIKSGEFPKVSNIESNDSINYNIIFEDSTYGNARNNCTPTAESGWEIWLASAMRNPDTNYNYNGVRIFNDLALKGLNVGFYCNEQWPDGYIIYGNAKNVNAPTLILPSGVIDFTYHAANWNDDATNCYIYFQVLDADDNVVAQNITQTSEISMKGNRQSSYEADKFTFKWFCPKGGQYKIKFGSPGRIFIGNISIVQNISIES